MVEVGGVERTRVDKERALKFCFALQLFITLSTASPPCFLTSLELVQGPVGQGRAELHACENWSGEQGGLNWSCGKVQKREESLCECFAFRLPPSSLSPSEEMESSKVSDGEDGKKKKKKKKATSRLLSSCSSSSICQRAAQSSPPALLRNRAPGDKGNQQRVRAASPPTSRRSSFVAAQNRPHQNSNPLSRFLS